MRKKKKKPAEQRATSAPVEKKTTAPRLSNGFVCPGGKLGVRIILFLCFWRSSSGKLHPFTLTLNRCTLLFHIQPTVESSTPVWTGSSRWPRAARWAESSTRPPRLATSPPTWSAARLTTTSQSRGDHPLHLLSPRWTTCCALVSLA